MRFRCPEHELLDVEEYSIPSAAASMHPCVICGQPAVQAYRPRANQMDLHRHTIRNRLELKKRIEERIQLRECQQWRLEVDGEPYVVRWDFRWKDPVTGYDQQYGTEMYLADKPTLTDLEHGAEMARSLIANEIVRKCGEAFLPPGREMSLPITVPARWV